MNNEKKDKDASYNEFIILAIDLIGGDYNESRRYADKLWDIATCFADAIRESEKQSIADGYVQNIQKAVAEFDAVCKGRKMVQVEKIKNICDCYLDVRR